MSYANVSVPAVPALLLTGQPGTHHSRKRRPVTRTNAD